MPQLDQYIFFSQILSLIFFFLLTYIYVRSSIIPKVSSILKFRKKKVNLLIEKTDLYNKTSKKTLLFSEEKGTNYLNNVSSQINLILSALNKQSNNQLSDLYNKNILNTRSNSDIAPFIEKFKIEKLRTKNF